MGRKKKDFEKQQKEKFAKKLQEFINMERFAYIYLDGERTNFIISSKGRVFSLKYNKSDKIQEMKYFLNKDGHLAITLKFHNKNYYKRIHRLVAEAFIPNPDNKEQVHHIDGDHLNNNAENLLWVTSEEHQKFTKELHQYDIRYGEDNPVHIYSNKQIHEVCKLLEENELSLKEIAEKTKVPYAVINLLRNKKSSYFNIKSNYKIDNFNNFKNRKYSMKQIQKVCQLLELKYSDKDISEITKVNQSMVKAIRLRKRWIHVGKEYNF